MLSRFRSGREKALPSRSQKSTVIFRIGFRTIIFSNRMFDSNGSDTGYTGKPRLYYIVNGLPIFVRVSGNGNAIPLSFCHYVPPQLELLRGNGNAMHLMSAGPLSFGFFCSLE